MLLDALGGIVDPACPIEWGHPLNRGLTLDMTIVSNEGMRGGGVLRDLVRGGKKPHDGTLTNGPVWNGPKGRAGGHGSLSFSGGTGADYVTTGNIPAISGANQFSVASWVYLAASTNFSRAWQKDNTELLREDTTLLNFQVDANPLISGSISMVGKWVHVVCVYDNIAVTQAKVIYINGVKNVSEDAHGTVSTSSASFLIGNTGTFNRAWDGNLDSVQVYNRPLSATEAAALYQETRRGNPERFRWIGRRSYHIVSAAGGVFQAAWAAGSNAVIQPMVIA